MKKMGWFGMVRGHSRSSAMPPFDRVHDFLFNFNRNYVSYLVPFSRYSRLLKVADFDLPRLHLVLPW